MLTIENHRIVHCVRSNLRQEEELKSRETGARFAFAGDIQALDSFPGMIRPFSLRIPVTDVELDGVTA